MSAQEQGYNGWKNYETWAVGMYLDGNYTGEGTYREVLDLVRARIAASDHGDDAAIHRMRVADMLKDYVEDECLPAAGASSIATDLLAGALSEVDWRELATHKIAEVNE